MRSSINTKSGDFIMDEQSGVNPVDAASEAMDRFSPEDSVVPGDDEASPPPAASAEERNWAELPWDVLSIIFRKAGAFFVMRGAQWVCREWRALSWEPQTWRVVDMTMHTYYSSDSGCLVEMAGEVIARSNGLMEEFHAMNFGDDSLMEYIADRTNGGLKSLRLISCGYRISHIALIELAKRSPQLEELEISFCWMSPEFVEAVGNACPRLKRFRLNHLVKQQPLFAILNYPTIRNHNIEAFGVANSMKELRHLALVGSYMSNYALHGILDKCQYLESLDIHECYNLNIYHYDDGLRERCARIKDLRLPFAVLFTDDGADSHIDNFEAAFIGKPWLYNWKCV